jgi:DNA-binding XRE family transcriptional regulator
VVGGADQVAHPPDSSCGGPLHRTFTRADNNLDLVRTHITGSEVEQPPKSVVGHVRRRRQRIGLTQKEAGEQIGVTESTINNWERNRTQPAQGYRDAIRSFLEYDPFR